MFTLKGETGWRRVSPRTTGGPALLDWGREGGRVGWGRTSARGTEYRDKEN